MSVQFYLGPFLSLLIDAEIGGREERSGKDKFRTELCVKTLSKENRIAVQADGAAVSIMSDTRDFLGTSRQALSAELRMVSCREPWIAQNTPEQMH